MRKYNSNVKEIQLICEGNTNHIWAYEEYEAGGDEDGGRHSEEHQEGHFGLHQIVPESDDEDHGRHYICQKNYATAVLGARMLRKKHVNCDISQFATKERKCFKMA